MTSNVISMADYRREKLGIIMHPKGAISQLNLDMQQEAKWMSEMDIIDAELTVMAERLRTLLGDDECSK